MSITLFYYTFVLILFFKLFLDAYLIQVVQINLTKGYKFGASCALVFLWSLNCYHFTEIDIDQILYIKCMLIQASLHWFLFDMFLNLLRGKEIFYNGKNSVLDGLLSKVSDKTEVLIKVLFIVLSIYLFIIL